MCYTACDFKVCQSIQRRRYEFAMMKKRREQWLEANKNRQIKSDSFPFFIYFFLSIIAGLTLINERSHHTVEVVCFSFFFRKFEAQMKAKRGHVRSYFLCDCVSRLLVDVNKIRPPGFRPKTFS